MALEGRGGCLEDEVWVREAESGKGDSVFKKKDCRIFFKMCPPLLEWPSAVLPLQVARGEGRSALDVL